LAAFSSVWAFFIRSVARWASRMALRASSRASSSSVENTLATPAAMIQPSAWRETASLWLRQVPA